MVIRRTRDNQWRTRFIDQDRVDLIHNGKGEVTLNFLLFGERHIVAQVIETELVVGTVNDVTLVLWFLVLWRHARDNRAYGHTKEFEQWAVPVSITTSQIVVHGHNVNALTRQRVQIRRQSRYQGLTLTGTHLGDAAFMQRDTTDQLDVEMAHPHYAATGFATNSECFWQKIVQRLTFLDSLPEFACFCTQLFIAECFHVFFERVDAGDDLAHTFEFTAVLTAENFAENVTNHEVVSVRKIFWYDDARA